MTAPLEQASLFSVIHGESGAGKSWLSLIEAYHEKGSMMNEITRDDMEALL